MANNKIRVNVNCDLENAEVGIYLKNTSKNAKPIPMGVVKVTQGGYQDITHGTPDIAVRGVYDNDTKYTNPVVLQEQQIAFLSNSNLPRLKEAREQNQNDPGKPNKYKVQNLTEHSELYALWFLGEAEICRSASSLRKNGVDGIDVDFSVYAILHETNTIPELHEHESARAKAIPFDPSASITELALDINMHNELSLTQK